VARFSKRARWVDPPRVGLCWMKTLPQPWTVAMEATIYSGWIYDHLLPHAAQIKVAHPLTLRAIAAAKKKNDQIDASKLADCLRCDFLPECHMMPAEIRDRRRTLRYRHLLVRQMVQMKNRVSGLLMETGVEYNKQRLHKVSYFRELLSANEEVHPSIRPLLKLSRETIERCQKTETLGQFSSARPDAGRQDQTTQNDSRSGSDHGADVGALEIGDVSRFRTIKQAISYCGLCGDQRSSADKAMRMPDWQRTQTQSSVPTLRSLRQQMDVWFCRAQEPMPRGIVAR
jgi:transposase